MAPNKPTCSKTDVAAALEDLKSKLHGCVVVEGRDERRPNAVINGWYVPRSTMFHGAFSYEKLSLSAHASRFVCMQENCGVEVGSSAALNRHMQSDHDGAPLPKAHVLFYSAKLNMWIISEKMDAFSRGLAYSPIEDKGAQALVKTALSDPSDQAEWHVLDGDCEAAGYTKDFALRCVQSAASSASARKTARTNGADAARQSDGAGVGVLSEMCAAPGALEQPNGHAAIGRNLERQKSRAGKGDSFEVGKGRAKRARTSKAKDAMEATLQEGRLLDGGVVVEGRQPEKSNFSINGVYALRNERFNDHSAYEKLVGHKRFLFYSAPKRRWKISNALDDSKAGYAHVPAQGKVAPSDLRGKWKVYESKEMGYRPDKQVACRRYEPERDNVLMLIEKAEKALQDVAEQRRHEGELREARPVVQRAPEDALVKQKLEDAPADSVAHKAVKFQNGTNGRFQFTFKAPDGTRSEFQTTVKAAGSQEEAGRIARLCYCRFEAGDPKIKVATYRNSLYEESKRMAQETVGVNGAMDAKGTTEASEGNGASRISVGSAQDVELGEASGDDSCAASEDSVDGSGVCISSTSSNSEAEEQVKASEPTSAPIVIDSPRQAQIKDVGAQKVPSPQHVQEQQVGPRMVPSAQQARQQQVRAPGAAAAKDPRVRENVGQGWFALPLPLRA
eukprot:CAMPEP_0117468970 /NCGR_PEP_ID=MMETSP0784-20121206/6452_1 /TAXON_ID=39447 /ORGANISM="" /LENGTH=674 /DNA_ID=CAMNT_0005262999 /DNA_START=127 /DNA_END=2150 /DNA_ORIENTATION=-